MKNKILKAITLIFTLVFIASGSALDSVSWLPYIICGVCLAWMITFLIANWEVISNGKTI